MEKPSEEFLKKKKQVLDNLESLEAVLSYFPEEQEDVADAFYEEIEALMGEVDVCKDPNDFSGLVQAGKEIEHNIDVAFCNQGREQIELSWPKEDF